MRMFLICLLLLFKFTFGSKSSADESAPLIELPATQDLKLFDEWLASARAYLNLRYLADMKEKHFGIKVLNDPTLETEWELEISEIRYVLIKVLFKKSVIDTLGLWVPKSCSDSNTLDQISMDFTAYIAASPDRPLIANPDIPIDYSSLTYEYKALKYSPKIFFESNIRAGVILAVTLLFIAGCIYSIISRLFKCTSWNWGSKAIAIVKCFDPIDNLKVFWPRSYYKTGELDWTNGFRMLFQIHNVHYHFEATDCPVTNFQKFPSCWLTRIVQLYRSVILEFKTLTQVLS